jgi:ABC transporter, permease protein
MSVRAGILRSGRKLFSRTGRHANRSRAGTCFIVLVLTLFGLFSLMPMVLIVNMAFKPVSELFIYPPPLFVQNPTLNSFRVLFDIMSNGWVPFTRYLFNTVFITGTAIVANILLASLAAYPLAKHGQAPGVSAIFFIVTASLMFSPVVNDVVNYMTISGLGWIDNYASAIVPSCATGLSLFLLRQFMVQIPDSLLDAARIDGAGEYRTLFLIILPNVKPALVTVAIFNMQALWGVGNIPYIYREEMKTLPYAMGQVLSGGIMRTGPNAAASVVLLVVPVVFFLLAQSRIMETMVASGLKE